MKHRSAGFTLLEILIGLAVAGLVLSMLGQAMQVVGQASRLWHGAVEPRESFEAVELAVRHMIERMDPGVWPEPAQIRGSASAVAFTTELPDPSTGGLMAADVRLEAEGGTLFLLWTPRGHGVPFGPPPTPIRVPLLDHVARLDLAYAPRGAGTAWRDRWTEEGLPGLLRLRIVPAAGGTAWPPIVAHTLREQPEQ
jgi:prepilin-type N-terminal cleavage/methylation domain-containing protein